MWRKDGPRFVGEIVFTEKEVSFTPFGPFDLFIKYVSNRHVFLFSLSRGSHKPLPWLANTIGTVLSFRSLLSCLFFRV